MGNIIARFLKIKNIFLHYKVHKYRPITKQLYNGDDYFRMIYNLLSFFNDAFYTTVYFGVTFKFYFSFSLPFLIYGIMISYMFIWVGYYINRSCFLIPQIRNDTNGLLFTI